MSKRAAPVLERGMVPIAKMIEAPYNPRTIDDKAMKGLKASLDRFGLVQEIVLNKRTGHIVGGHQRVAALRVAGVTEAPAVWVDLSDRDEKALNVALNSQHISGEFTAGLQDILDEVKTHDLGMFEELRLDMLLAPVEVADMDKGDPDDAPEVEEGVPVSVPGEVYELGPHRLVCGDSTTAEAWTLLMGDELAQMVWTDPPYGVKYVGKTASAMTIQNDSMDDDGLGALLVDVLTLALAHCGPRAPWYVASPPGPLTMVFARVLRELGVFRQRLVWLKDRFVLGHSDYHYRHEDIYYGFTPAPGRSGRGGDGWYGDNAQDTVLDVPRPSANKEHPTMKPVELVARCIRNSSKPGWLVVDPFGGSGTTLIASAKEGRVARLIELDPRYCDVIRKRWTKFARENGADPGAGALDS